MAYLSPFRRNRALAVAVILVSSVIAIGPVVAAVVSPAANRSLDGGGVAADVHALSVLLYALYLPAWLLSSLWLGIARRNAAMIAPHEMHRSRIWVWLGWFTPVVCLVFPAQIVDDVLRVTDRGPARTRPRARYWWAAFFLMWAAARGATTLNTDQDPDLQQLLPVFDAVVAVLALIALVLWIRIVLRVTAAQDALVDFGPPAPVIAEPPRYDRFAPAPSFSGAAPLGWDRAGSAPDPFDRFAPAPAPAALPPQLGERRRSVR